MPEAGEPTDAELLQRHVSGDPDAFGTLFARHRERLWAVAVRVTGDPEEAADGLQDAMIAAFRRAASFRGDSAVTTWLHRVVVNSCLDRLRRRAARPAVGGLADEAVEALAQRDRPPEESARAELALEVHEALATLPWEQRAALVLVDMLGYAVADAAGVLGVSTGTIKSRCARGRARLLPLLGHLGAEPGHQPDSGGAPPREAPLPDPVPGPTAGAGPPASGQRPGRAAEPGNRSPARRVSPGKGGRNPL